MSRRTSEASKAIRKAWEKEKELVAEGKGTRDWTTEQLYVISQVFWTNFVDGSADFGL